MRLNISDEIEIMLLRERALLLERGIKQSIPEIVEACVRHALGQHGQHLPPLHEIAAAPIETMRAPIAEGITMPQPAPASVPEEIPQHEPAPHVEALNGDPELDQYATFTTDPTLEPVILDSGPPVMPYHQARIPGGKGREYVPPPVFMVSSTAALDAEGTEPDDSEQDYDEDGNPIYYDDDGV